MSTPKDHLIVRPVDLRDMLDRFKENEHREEPYTCVILHLNALNGEKYTWTMGVDKHPA